MRETAATGIAGGRGFLWDLHEKVFRLPWVGLCPEYRRNGETRDKKRFKG